MFLYIYIYLMLNSRIVDHPLQIQNPLCRSWASQDSARSGSSGPKVCPLQGPRAPAADLSTPGRHSTMR